MKTVEEIYKSLSDDYAGMTGYIPPEGSEFSIRLYAYAAQIQALFVHMDWVEAQCFPQTAAGAALTSHALMRGLERKDGSKAVGYITFGRNEATEQALPIPVGTVCLDENLVRFMTIGAGVIPSGEYMVTSPAEAVEAGAAGNVAAGTVTLMSLPPAGVTWCVNQSPFSGGQDGEDDESLRARLLDSYRRLPNGDNAAFYQIAAMRHDGVAAADILPRVNGRGTVGVVIATAAGLPSSALIEEVRADLQALREIATDVIVSAPTAKPVTLSVQVAPQPGADAQTAIANAQTALTAWFGGTRLGKPVLLADLQHVLYRTPGVGNYRILSPTADTAVAPGQLPTLAGLTVNLMV